MIMKKKETETYKKYLKGQQVVSVFPPLYHSASLFEYNCAHSIVQSSIIIFNDQQFCRQTFSCKVLNIFTPYKQCAVTIALYTRPSPS